MSGVPGARLNGAGILPGCKGHVLRADGAPYHVATTTNLDPALGAIRFNPRQLTKDKLVDALTALGCHSLDVVHEYLVEASEGTMSSVDSEGFKAAKMTITVPINDAEKKKRGKAGEHPGVEEIQVAALEWIVNNKPTALENDWEYIIRTELNGNAVIVWNAPNFPESMTVETCWSIVKMYNAAAFKSGRTMRQLWEDTGDGMYSKKVAAPATHRYQGGGFKPPLLGCNPDAERFLSHTLRAKDGGCVRQVEQDKLLRDAKFDMDAGVTPAALKPLVDAPNRAVLRYLVAKMMEAEGGGALGEALEGGDEDDEEDGVVEVEEDE